MIKITGLDSKKVYAEGEIEDCFRKLNEQFPNKKTVDDAVYPEPLLVVRI